MQLDITRTHDALIKAGGELFAAHGFDAVSVRQISTQAHANVAAVNYHFGGKQGLYNEIIRFMVSRRRQIKIKDILEAHPEWSKGPEGYARALHEYVRAQLFLVFDKNEPQWLSRLWLREISQPTEAMDILLAEFFRPSRQDLQDFLSMACPTRGPEELSQ
jgi:AcrR family transcriptional regulator